MKMQKNLSSSELLRLSKSVREDLKLDEILGSVGEVHLVGSAALDLMVWPDLDMTIVIPRFDIAQLYSACGKLAEHPNVRQIIFRNDTGKWNEEPEKYPDGIFCGIDYRKEGLKWKLDIWFIKDADKQPDLRHVNLFRPLLNSETRDAIIKIKKEWVDAPEYGNKVTSYLIYEAVLMKGIRSVEDFNNFLIKP